ncbi:MAG: hypothetical protein V1908_03650, partial [Candidatus Peregrinibacteria bacterium]
MAEKIITHSDVAAALATLGRAPDKLLRVYEKEITALQVRAQATETLAGVHSADGAPVAPKPVAPAVHASRPETADKSANLFARPDQLDEALQRSEASYTERVRKLEQLGVLVAGGKLPLIAPVRISDRNVDALPITPWGQMADVIRRDEKLRHALAALDASDGLPLIQPDVRAGSLKRQIEAGQMQIYPTFDPNGDATGNLIPFGFDEAFLTGDDAAKRAAFAVLTKQHLLQSGRLHTDGLLGISFMDAGTEVSRHTLGMSMFTAVADARKYDLHVAALENYVEAQQLTSGKLDQDFWTWLNG